MRFPLAGKLEDAETGEVLIDRLYAAESFWQRLVGLQFARPLEPDSGLLLRHCRSVHTMCMRFSIDLLFLGADFTILEVRRGVPPWRIVIPRAKAVKHVVELVSGRHVNILEQQKTKLTGFSPSP